MGSDCIIPDHCLSFYFNYRDSSESSADEEDREAEQQQEASYVSPMRRSPGQRGLLPRAKPTDTTVIIPQPELQRGARIRRPSGWLGDDAWVRSQLTNTSPM